MQPLRSFSAVVEWENARTTGLARAVEMLRALVSQTAQLPEGFAERPELILLYDKGAVPRGDVEEALASSSAGSVMDVSIHGTDGAGYYQQKNIGAELATRSHVLFVDSDVIPEPGWLHRLLDSPRLGAQVVAGRTYVDQSTFLGRAYGLFWFFPLKSAARGLSRERFFFANNVLFNRDIFMRYRFPNLPLYRGQCTALARNLGRDGIGIYIQNDARVSHAPPDRSDFVRRALCEGYDRAMRAGGSLDNSDAELHRQLEVIRKRVENRSMLIDLTAAEIASAQKLANAWVRLRFAGQRRTTRSPADMAQLLGIPWEGWSLTEQGEKQHSRGLAASVG